MGLDIYAKLIVGVKLLDVVDEEVETSMVTKYNSDTGGSLQS